MPLKRTRIARPIFLFARLVFMLMLFVFAIKGRGTAAQIEPTQFQTENGMTVLTLEQNAVPIVTIQVLVRAGSVDDPKPKIGLANMTAALLEEGTEKRTSIEISEALDFMGADLSIRASKDYTTIQIRVLKKDLEAGFDLLSDLVIHPIFDPKEIARIRKQIVGEILSQQDQPELIASIAFQEIIYGDHPYRHPTLGFEASLEKIHRKDLVVFHNTYYRPNNAIIAVVGDITEARSKALVASYFGGWERGVSVSALHPVQALPAPALKRIEKDLNQATVILGHVGIDRANPDYYAIQVMNYILGGGGFSSRMMKDIRDDKGLVYSIYSYFSANLYPGAFSVTFQTKSSSAGEAVSAARSVIESLRATGATEEELVEAKAYLTGNFPLQIDTTQKIASFLATIAFYGLGLDYFDTYAERVNRVTREDVFRVALKYLHPNQMVLVIVGKQDRISLDAAEKGVSD